MQRVYLLISISLIFQLVVAQVYSPVENFTLSDGLPNNSITALYVDRSGLLWIGTEDGLSSFDGYSFHNYQSNIYDTNSLPNDYIIDIQQDENDNLWCITPKGASRFVSDLQGFSTVYYKNESIEQGGLMVLKGIAQDHSRGDMYVLAENDVSVFNPGTQEWTNLPKLSDAIQNQSVTIENIAFHENARIIVLASEKGIYEWSVYSDSLSKRVLRNRWDGELLNVASARGNYYLVFSEQKVWKVSPLTDEVKIIYSADINVMNSAINSVDMLNDSIIRIVDQERIVEYNILNDEIQSSIAFFANGERVLSNTFMDCGIFWIGSEKGLLKYTIHQHAFSNFNLKNFGFSNSALKAMEFDSQERLWLGMNSGDILILKQRGGADPAIVSRIKVAGEINQISKTSHGKIIVASNEGLFVIDEARPSRIRRIVSGDVTAFLSYSSDSLVYATESSVFWVLNSGNKTIELGNLSALSDLRFVEIIKRGDLLYFLQISRLIEYDTKSNNYQLIAVANPSLNFLPENTTLVISGAGKTYLGTSDGIFEHTPGRRNIKPIPWNSSISNQHIHSFFADKNGATWFTTNNGLYSVDKAEARIRKYGVPDGLLVSEFTDRLVAKSSAGLVCFGGEDDFVIFRQNDLPHINCIPEIKISEVRLSGKKGTFTNNISGMDTLHIDSRYRHLRFTFSSLDYWNPKENRMQYSLVKEGKTPDWKPLYKKNYLLVSNLSAGVYTLLVDGTNHEGLLTNSPSKLVLMIEAPFWQTRMAIGSYVVFLVLFFYISIYIRTKSLRKLNREYRERELIAKKVEIQKEELTLQNKNITDSINYAKRIQMALMPSRRLFSKLFSDSFIMHIPKDIVSGDFYWINEVDDRIYFAAVDCTGHGVPGAFMSIIGFDLFRRITEIEKKKQPAEVLNSLSMGFETIFRDVENITLRDGMDVAFCAIDKKKKVLEFAGAFNPLYLVRDNTITEIKGDRFSVGLNHEENVLENKFSNHVIPVQEGDILYIFTDGFADQFGGPEGKKYKYRRFRHLLLALHQLPMNRQVEFLERSILDWKGDLDQVDDMLVMGIRISSPKEK